MCLDLFPTFWEHHTLPFAYHWIAINFNCFIYVILKIAISSKAFLANLIQADIKNLILSKYIETIYHMIALLLYVLNMQENSRFSLGEGSYIRNELTKILALAFYIHAFVMN